MVGSKKPHLVRRDDASELHENDQSRMRMKSRDPDLRALEDAQQDWRDGTITQEQYIDRAIVLFMREVDPLMTPEQQEDMQCVLRFTCNTSPEMRVRLGLDPFGDDD
jgi:hypothetical protein